MAPIARNIGPGGCRRRYLLGGLMLAVGVAAALVLVLLGADRGLRVGLFVPFWAGALGFFQARGQT